MASPDPVTPTTTKSTKEPEADGTSSIRSRPAPTAASYVSVDFEVFGKVQKVYFRKYTKSKARTLGLKGWCQNTPSGSVIGTIQGHGTAVNVMKTWLRTTGSPKSQIQKVEFKNERRIHDKDKPYTQFEIII